jgi:small subunit ribosomal protein S20
MPVIKAAKKAMRSDAKKSVFNLRRKRDMKSVEKEIKEFILHKKTKEAGEALPKAYKAIDKAAKRGVIKKNTASRKKSRLSQAIKKIS